MAKLVRHRIRNAAIVGSTPACCKGPPRGLPDSPRGRAPAEAILHDPLARGVNPSPEGTSKAKYPLARGVTPLKWGGKNGRKNPWGGDGKFPPRASRGPTGRPPPPRAPREDPPAGPQGPVGPVGLRRPWGEGPLGPKRPFGLAALRFPSGGVTVPSWRPTPYGPLPLLVLGDPRAPLGPPGAPRSPPGGATDSPGPDALGKPFLHDPLARP